MGDAFTCLTCRCEPLGPAEPQPQTPHLFLIPVGGIRVIQPLHSRGIRSTGIPVDKDTEVSHLGSTLL